MTRSNPRARPVFVILLIVVLPPAVAGCGPRTGIVKGKVTVDGRPLNGGTVFFLEADVPEGQKNSSPGTIHEDGTYQADAVPVGPVKVNLMPDLMIMGKERIRGGPTALPPGNLRGAAPPPAPANAPPVSIPPKYRKFDTSGLTLTVHGGTNQFDIEMTSKKP
jgi:hypothetical protein